MSDRSKEEWVLSKHELFRLACASHHAAGLAQSQEHACPPPPTPHSKLWQLPRPSAGRVPQTKAGHRVQQLARPGTICSAILSCCNTGACLQCPVCRTAVSPGACLSLFSLFYYFSGNSNQWNRAWCTRWKMVSPSPSSLNLMNCLFSYQRVMSTKPHNIYSWNKRHRHGGAGNRGSSWCGEKKSWTFERRSSLWSLVTLGSIYREIQTFGLPHSSLRSPPPTSSSSLVNA